MRTESTAKFLQRMTSSSATFEITGRHYRTGRPVHVEIGDDRILAVRDAAEAPGAATLDWIAPGFIDLQSNGYGGQEFSSLDLTVEKVAEIAARTGHIRRDAVLSDRHDSQLRDDRA